MSDTLLSAFLYTTLKVRVSCSVNVIQLAKSGTELGCRGLAMEPSLFNILMQK